MLRNQRRILRSERVDLEKRLQKLPKAIHYGVRQEWDAIEKEMRGYIL
jgi:hypothetical protein